MCRMVFFEEKLVKGKILQSAYILYLHIVVFDYLFLAKLLVLLFYSEKKVMSFLSGAVENIVLFDYKPSLLVAFFVFFFISSNAFTLVSSTKKSICNGTGISSFV